MKLLRYVYFISILFFILEGCACWIAKGYERYIYFLFAVLTIITWKRAFKREKVSQSYIVMFVGLCLVTMISTRCSIGSLLSFAIILFAISTPFILKRNDKIVFINKINRFFTIVVFLSIIFHVFKFINLLPEVAMFQRGHYTYQNYLVYLYSPVYDYKLCGFCYEPGFFSLLLSALLLINGFDYRRLCVKIYLIALLMTVSLGGYILMVTCWYLYYTTNRTKTIRSFVIKNVIFLFFLILSYLTVTVFWNDGNNIVNEKIIVKWEEKSSDGIESRKSGDSLIAWANFLSSDSKMFGYGYKKYDDIRTESLYYDAASIAEYLMICGFVGVMIQILSIGYFIFVKRNIIYSLPGFTFLLLDFIQHGSGVESSMYILVVLWVVLSSSQSKTKAKPIVIKQLP